MILEKALKEIRELKKEIKELKGNYDIIKTNDAISFLVIRGSIVGSIIVDPYISQYMVKTHYSKEIFTSYEQAEIALHDQAKRILKDY